MFASFTTSDNLTNDLLILKLLKTNRSSVKQMMQLDKEIYRAHFLLFCLDLLREMSQKPDQYGHHFWTPFENQTVQNPYLRLAMLILDKSNFQILLTLKWNVTPLLADFGGRVGIFHFL